jgi:hypothetical protein
VRVLSLAFVLLVSASSSEAWAQQAPNPLPPADDLPPAPLDPAADPDSVEPAGDAPPLPEAEPESTTTSTTPTPTPSSTSTPTPTPTLTETPGQRRRVRLVYSAGPWLSSCPSYDELRDTVVGHLGFDPFAEPAERVVLLLLDTVDGADAAAPTRARVELLDPALKSLGTRSVTSTEGCRELVATAALQVSIAVEPAAVAGPVVAAPPTEPAAASTSTPSTEPPPQTPTATSTLRPTVAGLYGLEAHGSALMSPEAMLIGASAYAGARWQMFSGRVEARVDIPIGDANTEAVPLLLTLAPCAHFPVVDLEDDESLGIGGCLTVSGGVIMMSGAFDGVGAYVGSGGRASIEWILADDTTLRGFLQIEGALVRARYSGGADRSYTLPPVNVMMGFGVDLPSL